MTDEIFITLDVDWAPDWMVSSVADVLLERNAKATWFITHHSPRLQELMRSAGSFEWGVHPNLLAGSTHGSTEEEVLGHVKSLVPNARLMRTHALYQTTPFLMLAANRYGIDVDLSLFLPRTPNIRPHRLSWNGCQITRVPYFWEDDFETQEREQAWSIADTRLQVPGLKIFDFHPVHIYLNTVDFRTYTRLKTLGPISQWRESDIAPYRHDGPGPRNLFLELADLLAGGGRHVGELAAGVE